MWIKELSSEDMNKVVKNIRYCFSEYLCKSNIESCVVGLSGGVDSALCAILANPVCKSLGIKLIGRGLPYSTNKREENERADEIGELFCDDYDIYGIHGIFENFVTWAMEDNHVDEKVRKGNIMARMRMIYLYDVAKLNKGLVLSTDNLTEYLLGFWTLHGDVGDYGMIQRLWKTEVYSVARFLAEESSSKAAEAILRNINAVPTDGLGITDSDLEQIGVKSYFEVDRILFSYLFGTEKMEKELEGHKVIVRHLATGFKRCNPHNISKADILYDIDVHGTIVFNYKGEK